MSVTELRDRRAYLVDEQSMLMNQQESTQNPTANKSISNRLSEIATELSAIQKALAAFLGAAVISNLTDDGYNDNVPPVITVNGKGLITAVSTAAISTVLAISDGSTNDNVTIGTDTLTFTATSNETTVAVSDNTVTIGLPDTITANTTAKGSHAISIADNLIKTYSGKSVVKDVSLNLKQGEIVGLLGPNGAGKTTSFYMIVGLIKPSSGSIFLDDKEITLFPMYKRAQNGIGYLAQESSVFRKMSVEDNIHSVLEMTNLTKKEQQNKVESLLDEFGLKAIRKRSGDLL